MISFEAHANVFPETVVLMAGNQRELALTDNLP